MSLADYDILRIIGRGTYGEVRLVTHKHDRKQYVIKKMTLVKASSKERKAAEQEAKLLSKLRHPNIVSYKDSFEEESGYLYIVMGFAEGGDLYTKLREHREKKSFLPEQQVVRWYIQICMALQYLHERRILHRDLKTQNIFLTKTKMIKVGDLGIARVLESASDMATTLIGTPYYMSPELFSNRPYNHKSDVWALGCCIYEMVTLKHAFNAKDMNSLVYKILKGKMPPMPGEYSEQLCELIKSMLNQVPEKRPSVNRILRNPFIKKHIQLFLDESSRRRRPASGRSSRPTSGVSSGPSSRKTSVNSQGSLSPSPHPPPSAPEAARHSRLKGHSPIIEAAEPVVPKSDSGSQNRVKEQSEVGDVVRSDVKDPCAHADPGKIVSGRGDDKTIENGDQSCTSSTQSTLEATVKPSIEPVSEPPPSHSQKVNTNSNNSRVASKILDSGIFLNDVEQPKHPQLNNHQRSAAPTQFEPAIPPNKNNKNHTRVDSASSSSSSSSISKRQQRPLPKCPVSAPACEPKIKENGASEKGSNQANMLLDSMESVSSVASSAMSSATNEDGNPRISSARQRRRERQRKKEEKPPPIIEEIRKSRNSALPRPKSTSDKGGRATKQTKVKVSRNSSSEPAPRPDSGDSAFIVGSKNSGLRPSSSGEQAQPEMEEFMTLLHTTLNLADSKSKLDMDERNSPNSVSEDPSGLSVVQELTESNQSGHSYSRNTPAATPVSVAVPQLESDKKISAVSRGTLRSTQRLMDRIVSLRRDCIQGLGVPLLHRAYEVLDANENDDVLQKELVGLLGQVRFEQWAGKIWQLKFCEESLFGHCGTITAFN